MSHSITPPNYEVVIAPNRGWMRIDWRALWEYRDLLGLLVRREVLSKYKQTILGPAWFVISPLLTTFVFTVIFQKVAQIPTDGIPAVLFYLCGLLTWTYFSQIVTTGIATFQSHTALFSKVYFPRLTVPLAVVFSTLCALLIQAVTFAAFYIYYKAFVPATHGLGPNWLCAFIPLVIAQIGALSFGVTLWMCAVSAKYRDLLHLHQFIMQLWLYATPVIYPLSKIPPSLQWLSWANPLSAPTEFMRVALFGKGILHPWYFASSIVITLVVFLSGIMFYQRAERTLADVA